jgi:uncharacterized protein
LPPSQWLRFATDTEGRPLPPDFDAAELQALVLRRHADLDRAIVARAWFDPWVFELDDDASPSESVSPWVAGFALATEQFPALLRDHEAVALSEPLALLFRHLEPEDLEDADELLAEIETLEPPLDMAEAVEDLVRATLLLADISRPLKKPGVPRRTASRRGPRAGGAAARTAGKRRRLAGPQAKGLTASARSEPRGSLRCARGRLARAARPGRGRFARQGQRMRVRWLRAGPMARRRRVQAGLAGGEQQRAGDRSGDRPPGEPSQGKQVHRRGWRRSTGGGSSARPARHQLSRRPTSFPSSRQALPRRHRNRLQAPACEHSRVTLAGCVTNCRRCPAQFAASPAGATGTLGVGV